MTLVTLSCGNGTGARFTLNGAWTFSNDASNFWQLTETGSQVAGFLGGGLPRLGICGSVAGASVKLYLPPDSAAVFSGTFESATLVAGTIRYGNQVTSVTLTPTPGATLESGSPPNC